MAGKKKNNMMSIEECRQIWCEADAVCFNVDSTVIKTFDEGINGLAEFCGVRQQVEEKTRDMSFNKCLHVSLDQVIKPTRQQVLDYRNQYDAQLSEGIFELVSLLHERGTSVFLVSAGFRCTVEKIAEKLNIQQQNVFANRLRFYLDGEYAGYDFRLPTANGGRMAKVVKQLRSEYSKVVVVGTRLVDVNACPPADCFIGYGGYLFKENVKRLSSWYITDFSELIDLLKNR